MSKKDAEKLLLLDCMHGMICAKSPEQMNLDFALWNRGVLGIPIKHGYGLTLTIRTVGNYLIPIWFHNVIWEPASFFSVFVKLWEQIDISLIVEAFMQTMPNAQLV